MILLTTALYCEAKPFIKALGLKKDLTMRSHELFRSEDCALIVSGIGKTNAAIATTLLLHLYSDHEHGVVGNIGIAGAASHEKGELRLIHKVREAATGTNFYPEQLLRTETAESSLETFDMPVTDPALLDQKESLVDMEASGFVQAASRFVDNSRFFLFKCVSDNLECGVLSAQIIESLIEPHTDTILRYARSLHALHLDSQIEILTGQEKKLLDKVSKHLSLTKNEEHLLEQAAVGHKIRTGDITRGLYPALKVELESVEHAKQIFHETRSSLSTP